MTITELLDAFNDPFPVTHPSNQISLPVYESKFGNKPLIVLHELPGMSESFIRYCKDMAEEGFKVYMPLLFKNPGTHMGLVKYTLFCINKEFKKLFGSNPESGATPFTSWMLYLVKQVSQRHPGANIGLVGMCLTGGFAVAAVADPNVKAVASCQPAWPMMPWKHIKQLGMSDAERANAASGVAGKAWPCVKGYRYKRDLISREAHMTAVAETLPPGSFERFPDLEGRGHSTLTQDFDERVFKDVRQFMSEKL